MKLISKITSAWHQYAAPICLANKGGLDTKDLPDSEKLADETILSGYKHIYQMIIDDCRYCKCGTSTFRGLTCYTFS